MPLLGSKDVALTESGAYEAVEQHCEIEGNRRPRTLSTLSLRDIYCHLMAVGEASGTELRAFFRPISQHYNPDQGRYTDRRESEWWSDVASPNLGKLPGLSVEVDGDGTAGSFRNETWSFDGLSPRKAAEFASDENVLALEDLLEAPTVRAEGILDERGVDRRGVPRRERDDIRPLIMHLYSHLLDRRSLLREDVTEAVPEQYTSRARDQSDCFAQIEDHLAALPGVEVEHDAPRAPEEIPVETMQDVLDGYRELDREPTGTWRATPASKPQTGDIETAVTGVDWVEASA